MGETAPVTITESALREVLAVQGGIQETDYVMVESYKNGILFPY